jgi:hypothetical protein
MKDLIKKKRRRGEDKGESLTPVLPPRWKMAKSQHLRSHSNNPPSRLFSTIKIFHLPFEWLGLLTQKVQILHTTSGLGWLVGRWGGAGEGWNSGNY